MTDINDDSKIAMDTLASLKNLFSELKNSGTGRTHNANTIITRALNILEETVTECITHQVSLNESLCRSVGIYDKSNHASQNLVSELEKTIKSQDAEISRLKSQDAEISSLKKCWSDASKKEKDARECCSRLTAENTDLTEMNANSYGLFLKYRDSSAEIRDRLQDEIDELKAKLPSVSEVSWTDEVEESSWGDDGVWTDDEEDWTDDDEEVTVVPEPIQHLVYKPDGKLRKHVAVYHPAGGRRACTKDSRYKGFYSGMC